MQVLTQNVEFSARAQYTFPSHLQATLCICTTMQSIPLHPSAQSYKKRRTLSYHWRGSDSTGKCGRRHRESHRHFLFSALTGHYLHCDVTCQFLRTLWGALIHRPNMHDYHCKINVLIFTHIYCVSSISHPRHTPPPQYHTHPSNPPYCQYIVHYKIRLCKPTRLNPTLEATTIIHPNKPKVNANTKTHSQPTKYLIMPRLNDIVT